MTRDRQVLGLIPPVGNVTMADLLRLSGLSRPTITDALARLQTDDAIVCEPAALHGPGRPAKRWRRRPPPGMFAGIALSRYAVRVRVADGDDRTTAEHQRSLHVSLDARGALACGRDLLLECLAELGVKAESLTSLVLGLPCPVGGDRPQARGVLPDWIGSRPAEQLRGWLPGTRIHVENDANLGALGELARGAGRDCADLVYVKLAPGIGAALILGGRLYRGATGLAGEIGHIQINETGHPCVCGTRGCLIVEMHVAALKATNGEAGFLNLTDLFHRPDAIDALGTIGRLMGEQLGALANMIDPERVVISTDESPPHPHLLKSIRDGITQTALPALSTLPVIPSTLGTHAETLGAITLARDLPQLPKHSAT
jgi:predicted NBD/HSP70 family sugar kinase